jgi:predicted DCC family thiol-disulfide oxidoreductase YuxK
MKFPFADHRLIHSDATPGALAIARVYVFGLWCVNAIHEPIVMRAELPSDLRIPLGFMHLAPGVILDWLATPGGAGVFQFVMVAACAAAAIGFATRISALLAVALVIVWQTLVRSYMGFANHAEAALMLAALVLAISPCDRALTIWPRRRDDPGLPACQFPLVAILGLTCLIYLFIGSYRLTHGGPKMIYSSALTEWILSLSLRYTDPASSLGLAWIANPVTNALGKTGFMLLTILEVLTPLCLMSWRFRAGWLPAMFAAHLGILLLMRIDFTLQVMCYLFFIDSRHWAPARSHATTRVIYFDGVCGLCNGFVDFVMARDRSRGFRFAALQGSTATARFGDPGDVDPSTILFEEDGVVYEKSTAALRILSRLGGPWALVAVFGLVPRPVRDAVYDWVARNRYGWFGRRDTCRLPSAEERAVFLD